MKISHSGQGISLYGKKFAAGDVIDEGLQRAGHAKHASPRIDQYYKDMDHGCRTSF